MVNGRGADQSAVSGFLELVLRESGRREEALAAYERAIALDPEDALAKNNLAYLLAESGGDLDRDLEAIGKHLNPHLATSRPTRHADTLRLVAELQQTLQVVVV